jgi:hypothetical protein
VWPWHATRADVLESQGTDVNSRVSVDGNLEIWKFYCLGLRVCRAPCTSHTALLDFTRAFNAEEAQSSKRYT